MTSIVADRFGLLPDGREVDRFTLTNDAGARLCLSSLGAAITALWMPDRLGTLADVVLGYPTLSGYANDTHYLGATVGRFANRIRNATFSLGGVQYELDANDPPESPRHHLHGGSDGLHRQVFDASVDNDDAGQARVSFYTVSEDGHLGYPGQLSVRVTYTLTHDNSVLVDYRAHTTQETVVNLTQHAYFNLAGHDGGSIDDHLLRMFAACVTATDDASLPTGVLQQVAGTPLDFRKLRPIAASTAAETLPDSDGLDHNFVLDKTEDSFALAAVLAEPRSGRRLSVLTTEPGLQLYCANHLDGIEGKDDCTYLRHGAVCLETQHFPDSPNHPHFPSTTLAADTPWNSRTLYRFDTFSAR